MLAISAVPAEHLHRPLVVTVGDDTLLDETDPATDAAGCASCEEAKAPTYMAGEGHDPECPLRLKATLTEVRAGELAVGHSYAGPRLDQVTVAGIAFHGDTVLVTAPDGARHALDRDDVVQVPTYRPRPRARSG